MSDFLTTPITKTQEQSVEGQNDAGKVVTTTFVDDGNFIVADYNSNSISDDMVIKDQEIASFMAKPYLFATGEWNTTHISDTLLFSAAIAPLLSTTFFWANKLEGYNLVRGTAVIRLQINATPFQQGKLLLHFLPCAADFALVDPSYVATHNTNLTTKRMTPCVELDCRDSGVIMRIPYISPSHFYNRLKGDFDWGTIYVSVLSRLLVGTGSDTADYAAYIHFEDFELAAPLIPQSAGGKRKFSTKVFNRKSITEAEGESRTISSLLNVGSKVASNLASIPHLSSIMGPASWVMGILSGTASAFGWSKPTITLLPQPVIMSYDKYGATSDGVTYPTCLGLIASNQITPNNICSLTNEDELSFSYLKRISTLTDVGTWYLSDIGGATLYTKTFSPRSLYVRESKVSGASTVLFDTGPPLWYVGQDFAMWRGSFDVIIKLVKTDFHTGRLQITWTPVSNVTTSATLFNSNLALREIIDITEGSEIHLNLPFLHSSNYLDSDQSSGRLEILILTGLVAPDTCSPAIDFLVYTGGGEDMELAGPITSGPGNLPFSPQMGALISEGIGGGPIAKMTTKYAEQSNGEMFTSIKQLLNRSNILHSTSAIAASIEIWPWVSGIMKVSAGALVVPRFGGDMYSKYSNMYAFYRGSVRVRSTLSPASSAAMYSETKLTGGSIYTYTASVLGIGSLLSWSTSATIGPVSYGLSDIGSGLVHAKVPYRALYRSSLKLSQSSTGDLHTVDKSQPKSYLAITGTPANMTRSFDDDFQLSYFLGPPPLFVSINAT